jgi:hypothetical protein
MKNMLTYLGGGDLRSIGKSGELVTQIKTQADFDELFEFLSDNDRLIAMRAADVLEKISRMNPHWLNKHKDTLLGLLSTATAKELRWHLALMSTRLPLDSREAQLMWNILSTWVLDENESKIVRANALQGLSDLVSAHERFEPQWVTLTSKIRETRTPSLKARLKKLRR